MMCKANFHVFLKRTRTTMQLPCSAALLQAEFIHNFWQGMGGNGFATSQPDMRRYEEIDNDVSPAESTGHTL
jgi:hypothetical protein